MNFELLRRDSVLNAFAAHCQREPLDRRPGIWVEFIDIWNEPRGEIGIPDPDDIMHTCFALLSPWALIPTIGQAWLIVDMVEDLQVTNLKANYRGYFNPHWSVPYKMSDDGSLSFGEPVSDVVPPPIGVAVQHAKVARMRQTLWEWDHSIETMLPVVEGLLNR